MEYQSLRKVLWFTMFRLSLLLALPNLVLSFHDCIQPSQAVKARRRALFKKHLLSKENAGKTISVEVDADEESPDDNCSATICVGMHDGPHEGKEQI